MTTQSNNTSDTQTSDTTAMKMVTTVAVIITVILAEYNVITRLTFQLMAGNEL